MDRTHVYPVGDGDIYLMAKPVRWIFFWANKPVLTQSQPLGKAPEIVFSFNIPSSDTNIAKWRRWMELNYGDFWSREEIMQDLVIFQSFLREGLGALAPGQDLIKQKTLQYL